jgi:hypothetical protein
MTQALIDFKNTIFTQYPCCIMTVELSRQQEWHRPLTALTGMYIFFKMLWEVAKTMPTCHIPHASDILLSSKISSVLTLKIFNIIIIIITEVLQE